MEEVKAYHKTPLSEHIIELCTAFKIGNQRRMLLFPWADGGDLKNLFEQLPEDLYKDLDDGFNGLVRWVASQCRGLVSALDLIHGSRFEKEPRFTNESTDEEFGIHGDIKPQNILFFSQERQENGLGVLKLADFGMLRFHHRSSRTRPDTRIPGGTLYRAPEQDYEAINSRKLDVWALGCVFSEVLTWLISGPEAVASYYARRKTEKLWIGDTDLEWTESSFFSRDVDNGGRLVDREIVLQSRGLSTASFTLKPVLKRTVSEVS